jgi:polysaccharide chain length determinant protein (PEP-CTERM system associated)
MEETSAHVLDYLQILRRRKWWLITPVVLSIIVGGVLLQVLPKEFESNVTITVAAPAVATNYLNTGQLGMEERLRALSQQLVSNALLTRVITNAGFPPPEEGVTPEQHQGQLIGALRQSISVSTPRTDVVNVNTSEPRRVDAFVITYKDSDAERARRVADLLANEFIEENTKLRAERAEGTSAFIAQQLKESQGRLTQYESQLRDVKELHMGQLPEQMQANLSTLTGLRSQLESNATALRGAEDRLSMVERTVEQLAKAGREAEAANRLAPDPDSAAARLQQLERELARARVAYTPRHPEVQRLEQDVRDARAAADAERRLNPQARAAGWEQDPNYRQAVSDRDTLRLRIRDLQRAGADIERQIAQYQQRVESAPRVEQQLAAMVRDYELEKQQYAELSSKLHAATISESVERTGAGEQFTLLYPATLPTEPKSPVPMRVMLFSIAAGFMLGAGAILAREYFDRSVRDVRDLKAEFELPVLGKVARIHHR